MVTAKPCSIRKQKTRNKSYFNLVFPFVGWVKTGEYELVKWAGFSYGSWTFLEISVVRGLFEYIAFKLDTFGHLQISYIQNTAFLL